MRLHLDNHHRHLTWQGLQDAARKVAIVVVYVSVFCLLFPVLLIETGLRMDVLWPVRISVAAHIGGFVMLTGLGLVIWSMLLLALQGRGLPISHLPPARLVRSGPYHLFRHPIYVGFTIVVLGLGLTLSSFWVLFLSVPLLVALWLAYVLFLEEPLLRRRFGATYRTYASRRPLIVPMPGMLRRGLRRLWTRAQPHINRLANHTVALRRGSLILVTYGVLCATGALLYAVSTATLLSGHGVAPLASGWFVFWLAVATVTFSWLFWWIGNFRDIRDEPYHGLGRNGFISYGGLLGGIGVALLFSRSVAMHPLTVLDVMMQGLFLAYLVGRIGCLTYGCCFGAETHGECYIAYTNPEAKANRLGARPGVHRHPVQLYSAAHGILMVLVANAVAAGPVPAGTVTAISLVFLGIGRTFTESFRDRPRPLWGLFTYGHAGAWALVAAGWLLLFQIDPASTAAGPHTWTFGDFRTALAAWPGILAGTLVALAAFGTHRNRLGTWFG
ncbi:MAG: hypothetical protein HKN29_03120 [Rhodothermales bacterium]|nr:hypothetical protein [Rhodothermales bacterium]